ncbi:GyrI-like domain-containing protein [Natronoglycomyces albus]|uniref:GyrI-like domain-containing protein n=1 Tax=Natronoglycomyces albus TaxID=2811108 RepID=A0A895XQ09_9ACTN|nr:GyrI-like domain-containing protein [Natronoglycomyces albus]QSB04626.1 GyrI-like domain-containing protein [Natronoglycomyces albus]
MPIFLASGMDHPVNEDGSSTRKARRECVRGQRMSQLVDTVTSTAEGCENNEQATERLVRKREFKAAGGEVYTGKRVDENAESVFCTSLGIGEENTVSEHHFFNDAPHIKPRIIETDDFPTVVVANSQLAMAEMPLFMDESFNAIIRILEENDINPIGPAFALHRRIPDQTADFEVGFPVDKELIDEVLISDQLSVSPSTLPGNRIATVSYIGAYDGLPDAWGSFMDWVTGNGHSPDLPFWEFYVTEPTPDVEPSALRTDLYVPLAD